MPTIEVRCGRGRPFTKAPKIYMSSAGTKRKTTPAKFLVFFVKDKAAPVLKPVK